MYQEEGNREMRERGREKEGGRGGKERKKGGKSGNLFNRKVLVSKQRE